MYKTPTITLIANTPLVIAEIAARTCYDSFDKSESEVIRNFKQNIGVDINQELKQQDESSELVDKLVNVNFHESIIEHTVLTFFIAGLSRGVLMQLTRHRIASYSVQSTRYTLTDLIYVYFSSLKSHNPRAFFLKHISQDMLTLSNQKMINAELNSIFDKMEILTELYSSDGMLHKKAIAVLNDYEEAYSALVELRALKVTKRNAGDNIKSIVTDNFATELVFTINARNLKKFLKLRKSRSAWQPMQELAKEISKYIPGNIREALQV